MSNYYLRQRSLEESSDELKNTAVQLKECAFSIQNSWVLTLNNGAKGNQSFATLRRAYTNVLNEAAKMNSLRSALDYILQKYRQEESLVLSKAGTFSEKESVYEQKEKEDKRSAWRRFWDWVFGKDIDCSYTHTTDEQEAAADLLMQSQIESLLRSSTYSESTWKSASHEKRKEMLNDLLNDVAGIMGLLSINTSIGWYNKPMENGMVSQGYYLDGNRKVYINENIIETESAHESYQLMRTVVHELRHAYQNDAIRYPDRYKVSKETIASWKESFRTYQSEEAKGYAAYRNIVVEIDARKFAGQ